MLTVIGDFRLSKSVVFSTHYSLRFPRIQKIRYDKNYDEVCNLIEEELVFQFISKIAHHNKMSMRVNERAATGHDSRRDERDSAGM